MTEVLMWHSKKPRRSQLRGFSMRPVADAVNAYVNGQISEQEFRLLMTAACLSDPDAPMEQEPEAPSLD